MKRTAKSALVTGASRGIGRTVAAALVDAGWQVIAADVDEEAVQIARNTATADGLAITDVLLDVTDRSAVSDLMDRHGVFDVVVNNAGVAGAMPAFMELTPPQVAAALRVNTIGSFIVAQEAARRMTAGGAIVNIASRGYLGGVGGAHYVASKAAVVGMTRSMAAELRWRGIAVNAVAPGMIQTRMLDGYSRETRERLLEMEPSGAPLDAEVIARAVCYLASPAGRALSGQVLLVDGGKAIGVGGF